MSDNLKVLQVFIASPSDLADERRAIKEVADGLNSAFGKEVGLQIELLGWEDRLPSYGRPQSQINEDVDKADLFIGFLWRRWGSSTGDARFTSGFEEEFTRALERREKGGGGPEICLFFKDIDKQSLSDPGDQLKKVLEFREAVVQSKKALFRSFVDLNDWKEQTRDLLQRHLLKLLRSAVGLQGKEQPQAPPAPSGEEAKKEAPSRTSSPSTSAANQQAVRVWEEALEAIRKGEPLRLTKSEALDPLKVARIGFLAAGLTNRDIEAEMPGVHLTNTLFKHRKLIELTRIEWLLALRANLVPRSGFHPAWFWLKKVRLNAKAALTYLACHDDHMSVRKAALGYAKEMGVALHKGPRGKKKPIEVLCSNADADTRKAALEYLAETGSIREVQIIEKLRADPDPEVRAQAEVSRNAILVRENPRQNFADSVLAKAWVSEDSLRAVRQHIATIDVSLLRKALEHPDAKVKTLAAKELAARSSISFEEIKALKVDEETGVVRREYFHAAIRAGKRFRPEEIRKGLLPTRFSLALFSDSRQADPDPLVAELFRHYTTEELLPFAISESADAPIAYRVLAENHFEKYATKLRADLRDNFAALRAKFEVSESPASEWPSWSLNAFLGGGWKPDIYDFADAALTALEHNGIAADRELVVPFLQDASPRVRVAAFRALRRVGTTLDASCALQVAEEAEGQLATQAAKTALALAPGETGSAAELLKSTKVTLVSLAIKSLLSSAPNKVWPQVARRLYDEDEEIRKVICAYAVKKFTSQRLARLLDSYTMEERYFYNVVYLLDRAIYAPLPLRRVFIRELQDSLE